MAPVPGQKQHRRNRRPRFRKRARKPTGTSGVSKQPTGAKPRSKVALPETNDPLEKNIFGKEPMPENYVFVPKGDVYITRHCRSDTKESSQVVFAVYDRSGKRTLGIRVPEDIYSDVVTQAGLTASRRAHAVEVRDAKIISRGQELLQTEFPLMPEETLNLILDHSFLKGSGRVGRATTSDDKRKASLAVEAHIRHKHTQYENMLASGTDRKAARKKVWPIVVAIKEAWAGLSESQPGCLTLRPAQVLERAL